MPSVGKLISSSAQKGKAACVCPKTKEVKSLLRLTAGLASSDWISGNTVVVSFYTCMRIQAVLIFVNNGRKRKKKSIASSAEPFGSWIKLNLPHNSGI